MKVPLSEVKVLFCIFSWSRVGQWLGYSPKLRCSRREERSVFHACSCSVPGPLKYVE